VADSAFRDSTAPSTFPVIVDGKHFGDVQRAELDEVLNRGDLEFRTGLDGQPYLQPVRR
jgi:hypothetical protein